MTPAPLVTLVNVDVDIEGQRILHDVTLTIEAGEHWGIVGANGSGKSTLLRLLAGTAWPAPERGQRRYDFGLGPETDALRARERIVLVGHELQDRYARLGWNFSPLQVVLSGLFRTDVPRRQATAGERREAHALLERLDVAHLAERRFLELSRGEQRRVLIARGVAFAPSLLLLDEPASGLDRVSRKELATMLERVAEDCTIVCSAHVPEDLPSVVARYVTIASGRVGAAVERPPLAIDAAGETASQPRTIAAREAPAAAPIIVLRDANAWLAGRHVLRHVDWHLLPGQSWLVTGANGSGKSTFLRMLHGQVRPALGGELAWPGFGNPRNIWELRKRVAWLSPELQAAYRYPSTVRSCIASGFESSIGQTRELTEGEAARVEELLVELELVELGDRPLTALSYGQARRALIGRALANRPKLLLLDEPWEGLDAPMAALLNRSLERVAVGGTQLVCASHLRAHREHFTHELTLEHGRVTYSGRRRDAQ
jgi:molybdate transport system ATP-binding protein